MSKNEDRNRRSVSIEQLLIWAYHDQMVHQAQRGRSGLTLKSSAPLAASSSVWSEGAPVEASRNQGFEAADDAWRIHDQVMKLGATQVDCGQDLAAVRYHALPQYRGAEPPIGNGGAADNTARGATTQRPWPTDGVLNIDMRALVMIHASKATRPVRYAVADCRFKPADMVRKKNNSGIYSLGWFQHVTVVGILPGDQAQADAIYATWCGALRQLRQDMAAIPLTMFNVTADLPPLPKNLGAPLD